MLGAGSLAAISFRGGSAQTLFSDVDTRSGLSIRFGLAAGATSTGSSNIFMGSFAGRYASPTSTIALGTYAGESATGTRLVLIGTEAGRYASATDSLVVGSSAGQFLAGSHHVVLGARAGRMASGSGDSETLLGCAAGERATDMLGSNVIVGARAGWGAAALSGSVIVGFGAAAWAADLSSSVIIGLDAAPWAGGYGNVIIGPGAAGRVLASGAHCNVIIGPGADTVAPDTRSAVSIGPACAAYHSSVSVGSAVESRRMGSTSIGNDIVSSSDNTVSVGGKIVVNAVTMFKDALTTFASPNFQSVGIYATTRDVTFTDEFAVFEPSYSNVEYLNTSKAYLNSVKSADTNLLFAPSVLLLGTTVPIVSDLQVLSLASPLGLPVASEVDRDLRFVGGAATSAQGFTCGLGGSGATATASVGGGIATSAVAIHMALPAGLANDAALNFTSTAGAEFEWNVYLPKLLQAPTLVPAGPSPFIAHVHPFDKGVVLPTFVPTLVAGAAGLTEGPRATWIEQSPSHGQLSTNAFYGAGATYSAYDYALPSTGIDSVRLRAAHYPSDGADRAVPAASNVEVRLSFSSNLFYPATVPLVSDGVTQVAVVPYLWPTDSQLTVSCASNGVVVGDSVSFSTSNLVFALSLGPGASNDPTFPITFACTHCNVLVPSTVVPYTSDALVPMSGTAACNVIVTSAPSCGYLTLAEEGYPTLLLPGVAWRGAFARPSTLMYTCLDGLSAPNTESVTLVANPWGSTGNHGARMDATVFDRSAASPIVHVRDVVIATDFAGVGVAQTAVTRFLSEGAAVSFPASNVVRWSGALEGSSAAGIVTPATTFSIVSSNVAITSNYAVLASTIGSSNFDGSLGSNVDVYTGSAVFFAQNVSSNMPSVVHATLRQDSSNITRQFNSTYVVDGQPTSIHTFPLGTVEYAYASHAAVDAFFALGTTSPLFTSNYALPLPANAVQSRSFMPSTQFTHVLSNVALTTSNANWCDYRSLAPDHLSRCPDASSAFVVSAATATTFDASGNGLVGFDLLHTQRGHGLLGVAFSTADLAAGRVWVRPTGASPATTTKAALTYADGSSQAFTVAYVSSLLAPGLSKVSLPPVAYDASSPFPPSSLVLTPSSVAAALPAQLASDPSTVIHIVPSATGRPGYWAHSTTYASPFPDLSATLGSPLCYHYGRSGGLAARPGARASEARTTDPLGRDLGGLYWAQSFEAFATSANMELATQTFGIDVAFAVTRNVGLPYNAGLTDDKQLVTSNVLCFPSDVSSGLTVAQGLHLQVEATGANATALSKSDRLAFSVDHDFAVAGSNLLLGGLANGASLAVRPYWFDESSPHDLNLAMAFHHEGHVSSNVWDAGLLTNAYASNVMQPASAAKLLVTRPPAHGFLTFDGVRTVMEVPLLANDLSALRYVSLSDVGSNDVAGVRFSRVPGACGQREYALAIKHYVYTSSGAHVASNLQVRSPPVQFSAGYLADGSPDRLVRSVAWPEISGWSSRFALATVVAASPPARYACTLDRADKVSLAASTPSLLASFAFDPAQAASIRFVVLRNPAHGVVARFDEAALAFEPVRWAAWEDVVAGRIVYQHDGSSDPDVDELTFCVGTHDYDVDATVLYTLRFTVAALPVVTVNAVEAVYGGASSAHVHAMDTRFLASETQGAVFHVASKTNVVAGLPSAFTRTSFPGALQFLADASQAPTFTFQATNSSASNVLIAHPRFAPVLTQSHGFVFDYLSSRNLMLGPQPVDRRVAYYFAPSSASSFVGRRVVLSLSISPTSDLVPTDPSAAAVAASLVPFAFSISMIGGPTLKLTPSTVTVTTPMSSNAFALPAPIPLELWTTVALMCDGAGAVSLSIGGLTVPTPGVSNVDLSGLSGLEFVYDVANNMRPDVDAVVDGIRVFVVAPLVTMRMQDLQLSQSSYSDGLETPSDIHNVVVGQNIAVNGINNIAIGRSFSTSGDGSIVVGTNIGMSANQTTSLFECITIGNNMFLDAAVTDIIAMGKNIMNDIALNGTLKALNAFMGAKPIVIGNEVSATMLPYAVNVGNAFLRGVDGRIYLGASGEQVCIGQSASIVASAPVLAGGLSVGGAIQNAAGAVQFSAVTQAPEGLTGPGWVMELSSMSTTTSTSPATLTSVPCRYYASPLVVGVTTATPGSLQASGIASVWVSDYGDGSNLPAGTLVCTSPRAGCAAAQWTDVVTGATVGKLLQPSSPSSDASAIPDGGGGLASLVLCLLKVA